MSLVRTKIQKPLNAHLSNITAWIPDDNKRCYGVSMVKTKC